MENNGILQAAVDTALQREISVIIIASTTGDTALKLLTLIAGRKVRLIVVTSEKAKNGAHFKDEICEELRSKGVVILTNRPPGIVSRLMRKTFGRLVSSPWQKYLSKIQMDYGTGVRVCHKITRIVMHAGIIEDGRIVAVAGTKRGADCAVVLATEAGARWPRLEEVIPDL